MLKERFKESEKKKAKEDRKKGIMIECESVEALMTVPS